MCRRELICKTAKCRVVDLEQFSRTASRWHDAEWTVTYSVHELCSIDCSPTSHSTVSHCSSDSACRNAARDQAVFRNDTSRVVGDVADRTIGIYICWVLDVDVQIASNQHWATVQK